MKIESKSNIPRSDLPVPAGHYAVAILKCEAGASKSSGADQVTWQLQVLAPDSVVVDGQTVKVAGRTFRHYTTFSENNLERAIGEAESVLGEALPESFDTADVAAAIVEHCKGKMFPSLEIYPTERVVQDAQYKPILKDGQVEVIGYDLKVRNRLSTPIMAV